MLGVTTIGSHSHVGSQALGEDHHRFVDMFLSQFFSDGLQGDFQLISHLRLRLEFMVLFQHGAPDVIVQRVQIWRACSEGYSVFSMNPFAFSQFCMTLAH